MFEITNIIYVYFAIIVLLILFNSFYIIYDGYLKFKMKYKYSKYKTIIKQDLTHKRVHESSIKYFQRQLKNINNLRVYNTIIDELSKKRKEEMLEYYKKYEQIYNVLSMKYIKYNSIKKSYFAYVMSKCFYRRNIESDRIIIFINSLIKDKSIYARENAMLFLYSNGNKKLVIDALIQISKNNIYYNQILLTNDLFRFSLSEKELKEELINNYKSFNTDFKISIINYFRFSKSNDYKDFFLQIFDKKREDKDIIIALIRLFGKHTDDRALKFLLVYLNNDSRDGFDYKLASADALKRYNRREVKLALIDALMDDNWNVRNNAAKSLINFKLNKSDYKRIEKNRNAIEMWNSIIDERGVIDESN